MLFFLLAAEKDSDISAFQMLDKSNCETSAKNAKKLKGAAKSRKTVLNNRINFKYYAKRNTQKSKNAKPAPPKC
jgi:myo-inositol-hexaphosphate 3-phosphohydrolase